MFGISCRVIAIYMYYFITMLEIVGYLICCIIVFPSPVLGTKLDLFKPSILVKQIIKMHELGFACHHLNLYSVIICPVWQIYCMIHGPQP